MRSEDFQAVYRELYPSLARYVHRYTGDTDVAADIVQDAFLRLLEHDLPRDEVRPWIFVVATNLARDRVRTKERRRRLLVANPAIDFDRILVVRALKGGKRYSANWL